MYKKEYNHTPKRKQAHKLANHTIKEQNRLLVRLAKDRPCIDCNKSYHHSLMDFDHRPGEVKLFGINEYVKLHRGPGPLIEEIAKCDPVCCLCHRIRTWNRAHPDEQISL